MTVLAQLQDRRQCSPHRQPDVAGQSGDEVQIANVGVLSNANGVFPMTVVDARTLKFP